ncbi:3567_t:CDS:2, partial [Rhizophagus irregularis]
ACKVAMRFCWLKSNRRETLSEMQKLIKLRDLINQYIIEEYNEASGCPDCNVLVIN